MYTQKIPDDIFNDIAQNAIVQDKRGFVKFHKRQYDAFCSQSTKQWIEASGYEPKFVAFFVKQKLHQITIPDCIQCGKQITPKDVLLGHKFCSHYCQTQSEQRKASARQTNLEKYGVVNPAKNKDVLEKRKRTCNDKYGADSVVQSDYFKEKAKQTLQEHYGVDAPFKNEQIKQKAKQSLIDSIGADNPFKLAKYQQKAADARKLKYGVEYFSQTDEYKQHIAQLNGSRDQQYWDDVAEKRKRTNLEKYGVEYTSSLDTVKQQIRQTNLQRYGAVSYTVSDEWIQERKLRQYDTFIGNLKAKSIELLTTKTALITSNDDITLKCTICGHVWTQPQTMCAQLCRCSECAHNYDSLGELQLLSFIQQCIGDKYEIITNDRYVLDGKELDIFIPQLKLAFEFNGNYWHCDSKVSNNYHLTKTQLCHEKGIRLIHIFEYQWYDKRSQVMYFIQNLLEQHPTIVYGRKCEVIKLSVDDFNSFVNQYHMQGVVQCSTRLGLVYNKRLIAVAGFSKNRFKRGEIELTRYCALPGYRIVGGLEKLIKHTSFDKIVSYVDYSHFDGQGFVNAGFKLISTSTPNYVWVKNATVYSRYQTQKHNLPNILQEDFNPELSEIENMQNAGFNRLFDCGNLKFEWIRDR